MKTRIIFFVLFFIFCSSLSAQIFKFDFTLSKKQKAGYEKIDSSNRYGLNQKYGYDLIDDCVNSSGSPFFFSIDVPDGNYKVIVLVGSKQSKGSTTLRGESRRLFYENVITRKGEIDTCCFTINKRTPYISEGKSVNVKPREVNKLNWDNKLTLEFNGDNPVISELIIEKVEDVPTVFLCGNSTVVDQDEEPWASWGQMITRFFTSKVCFANYAESGEAANTFIAAGRLNKILSLMKKEDYILIEFGHNDQKQKGPGKGAFYSFMTSLKIFIDEAQARGAYPILVTPTQRRSFDSDGKIKDTHDDYPEAMKWLAAKENIPLIDLNESTRVFYEALGLDKSKKAFVHYPAGSYSGQCKDLADNTHFNPYGAYMVAKCVIEGMRKLNLPILNYLHSDYLVFNPAIPDDVDSFKWNDSPFIELIKPDGN